jgi:hypothetical protein
MILKPKARASGFDAERDAHLGIAGGPLPPAANTLPWRLRRQMPLDIIIVLAVIALSAVIAFSGADLLMGRDDPIPRSRTAPVSVVGGEGGSTPSPSSSSASTGLSRPQLAGLANAVATEFFTGGNDGEADPAVADAMLSQAQTLTGCDLQAFLGGPPGRHEDLSDPGSRRWIRHDADSRGWDVAFGHAGGSWMVVAQAC